MQVSGTRAGKYMILDGFEGIQEYIARDANNIARVEDESNIVSIEPSNNDIIIIIYIGLCVSSY